MVNFNGGDDGRFGAVARACDDTCSSGERVLLHAVLYVTDFAWLADELAGGRAWRGMADGDGEWGQAVAGRVWGGGVGRAPRLPNNSFPLPRPTRSQKTLPSPLPSPT